MSLFIYLFIFYEVKSIFMNTKVKSKYKTECICVVLGTAFIQQGSAFLKGIMSRTLLLLGC